MCCIAGSIGKKIDVKTMLSLQRHRAPDDEAIFEDDFIQLGMGRLSIIDLDSPGLCLFQDDRYVLSYNGEIYNFIELRAALSQKGHTFTTSSDTEVLLAAWRQWGTEMFGLLNGMYAFAIYDRKERKVTIARDVAGEKPLYYYIRGKTFAFASEAKAFADFKRTPREDRFMNAFQHCHERTLFEEVYQLLPAHYLEYDLRTHTHTTTEYWTLSRREINEDTALEELDALLEDSVRLRVRSDVPYGLYYSKGIDSSILSTMHNFVEQFYFDDSLDWKDDFYQTIEKVAWHLDFPVGSLSSYPLWKLAERAKKRVRVVLSGEGADEIFGGYVRYLPIGREWELRQAYPSYSNYLFAKYFPPSLDGYTHITRRNEDFEFVREQLRPYFEMFDDPVSAMGYADFKLIMPSLLQMGDRMAGAFGIENRCPFLDKRVIEFGFSLPAHLKISGLEQKIMLRRVLEKRNLLEPLRLEKKGLTIRFNSWFGKKDWDRGKYFALLTNNWEKTHL